MRHATLCLGLVAFGAGCSSSALNQSALAPTITAPKSHLRIVETGEAREPGAVDIALRDGVIRATLREQGPLVRLDLLFMNDGLKTLRMPPSTFTLVDANERPLHRLSPGDAADLVLGDDEAGAAAAGEIFASGLTDDTRVGPRSKVPASLFWQREDDPAYPLSLRAPKLATELAYAPEVIGEPAPMLADASIISDMAYPDDTAPLVPFDHGQRGNTALFLYGGYNSYAMDDLNDDIETLNADIAPFALDPIDGDIAFGADVFRNVTPALAVGVGVERILGETRAGDDSASMFYDVGGWAVRGLAQVRLVENRWARVALEGGAGVVSVLGEAQVTLTGVLTLDESVSGFGLLGQVGVPIEFAVHPRVALTSRVGYRYAPVSSLSIDGTDLVGFDNEALEFDYSGPVVHGGITLR